MKSFFKYISLGLIPASVLTSCLREEFFQQEDMRIKIEAHVGSSVLSTKSVDSPGIDYDYQGELNISLIRWDESAGNGSAYGKPVINGIMRQPEQDGSWRRNIDFAPGHTQFYASRTDEVGFAAWYPDAGDQGWVKENDSPILQDNTMRYNIDGKTDVMVSDMHKGTFETGLSPLKFRHALCLFNIYVYAVDEETRREWGKLNQVSMQNLPEQLVVNLPDDMNTDIADFTYGAAVKDYALLPEGSGMDIFAGSPDKSKCHLSTVIAGVPASKRLGIKVVTENQKDGNSLSIVRDFKPGHAYNIFLRLSTRGVVNAEVTTGEWIYDGNDYIVDEDFSLMSNLSRYGTANCYIVSSGNRGYSFDATIKGNGVNTITTESGKNIVFPDKDVNITDVDSVGILRNDAMMKFVNGNWVFIEDTNERRNTRLIELLTDELSRGRVLFKTVGDPSDPKSSMLHYKGNVKIGVFSKGKVIWSWHIWITDIPKSQGYSNGYVSQDRNLGAVTVDYDNYRQGHSHWSGFYYQFGRKDPIYRATVDASFGAEKRVVEHPVPVAEAHSNPMNYYYDKSGNSNNWTTDENSEYFWGFKSVREDIIKTMYDPCPPGYRVPGTGIFEQSDASVIIRKVNNTSNSPAGYVFNIGDFVDVYYPNTICIADGQVQTCDRKHQHSAAEESIFLSVATPYDPTLYDKPEEFEGGSIKPLYKDLAWHFHYSGEPLTNAVNTIVSDPVNYHTKRSAAFPVRCVLEDSKPEVTDLSEFQTANSYIVSETGFYKFNATKRGNGVTGLNVVSNNGTTYRTFDAGMGASITGIDRVEVLWWQGDLTPGSDFMKFVESNPTSSEIEAKCPVRVMDKGHLRNGTVEFIASANSNTWGNVGLAAYDENDRILWTWHIWIQPGVNAVKLGKYTIMDRNLGATYAPQDGSNVNFDPERLEANIGFYYQWGRKDPFFTSALRGAGSGSETTPWFYRDVNTGEWEKRTSFRTSPSGTIQESVERPLDFFRQSNPPGIWHTTYGASASSPANDFWGYVGVAGSIGESFAKTMYDPCPPGYKVMQHNVFESANICSANESTSYKLQTYEYTDKKDENKQNKDYGVYLHNGLTAMGNIESTGVWFPNSGYINSNGDFKLNGDNPISRVSTATPFSSGNILNCREMRWTRHSERAGSWWQGYHTLYTYRFSQNNDTYMADARVVRCQME